MAKKKPNYKKTSRVFVGGKPTTMKTKKVKKMIKKTTKKK